MAKTFYPIGTPILVDATCGPSAHAEGTKYQIALGTELTGNYPRTVLRIQMFHTSTGAQGMRSPSFPIGCDDFDRVSAAALALLSVP